MSEPVYGGPEMQAYTAQREREFAERQAQDPFFAQLPTLSIQEAADALNVAQSPGLVAMTMRDEFAAYLRGWSDGASAHAMRSEFTNHATLVAPYNEGCTDGRKARNMAHVAASEKYGVRVSVLRTPEKIGPCDQG